MAKTFDDLVKKVMTKQTRKLAKKRARQLLGELTPAYDAGKVHRIKNAQSYQQALTEIETLMDARRNTPDGKRLDALVMMVAAWEEKHSPISAR
jgi:hypothetical protein